MKKIMCIMLCIMATSLTWSQEFHVASGGLVTITPEAYVYSVANVTVDAAGDIVAESDDTDSASLISAANIVGDVTYKRHIGGAADAGTIGTNWHLVSAPVGTEDIATFAAVAANEVSVSGTKYAIAYYKNDNAPFNTHTEEDGRWVYYTTTFSENFVRGEGYSTHRESNGVYTFKGAVDNAAVSVPMVSVSGAHFWFCVGNPYPSFLSTTAVFNDNAANLDAVYQALYVWDGTQYLPKNLATPGEYLAPGQAFMVGADVLSNDPFVFNRNTQAPQQGATDNFYRSASVPNVVVSLSNGNATKTTELKYFSNTTTGLDIGWDAGAYRNGTPSFSIESHLVSDSNGVDFALQALPTSALDNDTVIPLAINAAAGETLTFSVTAKDLPAGVSVYLEDTVNGTFTNLTEGAVELTTATALSGIGRFYIRNSSKVLSVDTVNTVTNALNLYKTDNNIRVTGLTAQGNATIKMYTISGKEVLANQFVAERVKDIALPTNLATGVYIVSVVSENGKINKKLIIE